MHHTKYTVIFLMYVLSVHTDDTPHIYFFEYLVIGINNYFETVVYQNS